MRALNAPFLSMEVPSTFELIKSISVFLFFAPEVHLSIFQRMWVDGVLHKSVWEDAFKKMNEEWADITILVSNIWFNFYLCFNIIYFHSQATIILTATVSFLNIANITNKDSLPYNSSCISIAATIGSIILGLLLKRQHHTKIRDTTGDIVRFKLLRIGHSLIPAFLKIAKDS